MKTIKSSVILPNEKALKDYLEKHPNTRKDTDFIVDGVKRKITQKNKNDSNPVRTIKDMEKSYVFKDNRNLKDFFNKMFDVYTKKDNGNLKNISKEYKEMFHNKLNEVLKRYNFQETSKEETNSLIEHYRKSYIESKNGGNKEEKKEHLPKREPTVEKKFEREEVLNLWQTDSFKKLSRKDHFNLVNDNLERKGHEKLTIEEYKDYLRKTTFNYKPSNDRKEQNKYAQTHFCDKASYGNRLGIDEANWVNEALTDLAVDYPVMDVPFDKIYAGKMNNGIYAYCRYATYFNHFFQTGKSETTLKINPDSAYFKNGYVPKDTGNSRYGILRSNVSDADTREECIKRTITHEVGHDLYNKRILEENGCNKYSITTSRCFDTNNDFAKDWEKLYNKSKQEKITSQKISAYSNKNVHEFFAECFTMFRHEREKLPKNILEKMEEFDKWCSTMK